MITIEAGLGIIIGLVGIIATILVVCFVCLAWYVLKFKTIIKLALEYTRAMEDAVNNNYDECSKQVEDLVDVTKDGVGSIE